MPSKHSFIDRLYYANRREYTEKNGNVAYLDGSPLNRPMGLKGSQIALAAIIVAAALVIGVIFLNNTVLNSLRETQATAQAISDNLAREASIETIPIMTDVVSLSDDEIRETFNNNGFTIVDVTEMSKSDDMILYKLAYDMSVDEATAMLSQGISALTPAQATKFLNGSWYFSAERSVIPSMVVRYADFSTGDPLVAVQNALDKQGFDPTDMNSGVDDSGNTFDQGVVEVGDKTYKWTISALPLSDMYSITGMPEEACYVGVRLTEQ